MAGPDAEDFLQRMLSNDVTEAPCRAMLLTPKARLIAPLVVVRRTDDDFLLLTEPGLGETVGATLLRARFAAKVEIEPEEHTSVVVFGEDGGIPNEELGEPGSELLDADVAPTLSADEVERVRIESATPAWGKELDDTILPAEAGLDETHVSFTKGCYPGQEPIARLRHRGKVNRTLRLRRRGTTRRSPRLPGFASSGSSYAGSVRAVFPFAPTASSASSGTSTRT